MLGTLDFTGSEHQAAFNFPLSTALPRLITADISVTGLGSADSQDW